MSEKDVPVYSVGQELDKMISEATRSGAAIEDYQSSCVCDDLDT
jgi:hypothetical protein